MVLRESLDPDSSLWDWIAVDLYFYRNKVGLSCAQLGRILRVNRQAVSNMEAGRVKLDIAKAKILDELWGLNSHFQRLVTHARAGHDPNWFKAHVLYEQRASVIKTYEAMVVPGLLQNEDYARALLTEGRRSKGRDSRDGMIWVDRVDPRELDGAVADTAHTFQAQVEKVADVRVTVAGRHVSSVRIDSDLLDWRADYDAHTYTIIICPAELETAIQQYMNSYGLLFAAFDFALTSKGDWIFMECNPNGQWAWIAEQEEVVADSLADLLQKGFL